MCALASSAASSLAPSATATEASVAALGWARETSPATRRPADMRDALSAMRREAERAFSPGARGGERKTETENEKEKREGSTPWARC